MDELTSNNGFNYVVIIDSIPKDELQTARRLNDDLEILSKAYEPNVPGISYVRIEGEIALFGILDQIIEKVEGGYLPLLHFECHGGEDGLELADRTIIKWERLIDKLAVLNEAMRLNLMVVFAACFGASFIEPTVLSKRAPVWGLIGPVEKVSAEIIEKDFGVFYRTLFSGGTPSSSIKAFSEISTANRYYKITTEEFFYQVWKAYKETEFEPSRLDGRLIKLREQIKRESPKIPIPSVHELQELMITQEPSIFDRFRDTFFMCDLYPEHQERFNVTYEKAEKLVASSPNGSAES